MIYKEPEFITQKQVEDLLLSENVDIVCEALISASLYISDNNWVESKCFELLENKGTNIVIKKICLTALSHLVRIHSSIDKNRLKKYSKKIPPELKPYLNDLKSDIKIFYQD